MNPVLARSVFGNRAIEWHKYRITRIIEISPGLFNKKTGVIFPHAYVPEITPDQVLGN